MMFVVLSKQKSGYEVRISDWSSDVCSSELVRARTRPNQLVIIDESVAPRRHDPPCPPARAVIGEAQVATAPRLGEVGARQRFLGHPAVFGERHPRIIPCPPAQQRHPPGGLDREVLAAAGDEQTGRRGLPRQSSETRRDGKEGVSK